MTKIILNSFLVALMLGSSVAYAENASTTATSSPQRPKPGIFNNVKNFIQEKREVKTEAREKIKDVREEKREDLKNLREEAKENREDRREDRQENRGDNLSRLKEIWKKNLNKIVVRFQATLDRENKILAKIVARIEKVKSLGGNTTESEKSVAEAKIHLSEAQTAINTLKNVILTETATSTATTTSSTASSTPIKKESSERIRRASEEVKKHLRAAHQSMVQAIVKLKGVSSTVPKTATTTPATATSTATTTSSN